MEKIVLMFLAAMLHLMAWAQGGIVIYPQKSVIVSTPAVWQAAEELKLHLKLITGVDVPECEKPQEGKFVFSFVPSMLDGNSEACGWKVSESGVEFKGNVYFAVVDFLENALGVRWPEGDMIAYEARNPVAVKKLSGEWAPELKIRRIRMVPKPENKNNAEQRVFVRRMREGHHDEPLYGHAFVKHWKLYGKDHPEYFGMRKDGVRAPKNVKAEELMGNVAVYDVRINNTLGMCVTSTGLVAQIVADWKKAGAGEYINLCENDIPGQDSCQCPSCKALDVVPENFDPKWEVHYADRYVWFGNQVLAAARKVRADVKICYYAYNATQEAPQRERPDPATVAGLVPTYFSDSYISDYVDSWKKAGLVNFFYRPNRHYYYHCPYLPLGCEEHFVKIFHYLYSQGAIGFDYDAIAAYRGSHDWFERYLLDHAMQDPSKPFSHWEHHYCAAYGAAADDVKAYYRYWREELWTKRLEPKMDKLAKIGGYFNFGRGLYWLLKDYYKTEDFEAAEKYVAVAETKNLSPTAQEMVKRLRIRHDHSRLFFEAVAHKSKENTEKLVAFRQKHDFPLYPWGEQHFGDVAGIRMLLGPEKKMTNAFK